MYQFKKILLLQDGLPVGFCSIYWRSS